MQEHLLLQQLRQQHLVVFNVANTVTSGKVADALSAIGASPIMSAAPEEAAALVQLSSSCVLNLGTVTVPLMAELRAVAKAANTLHRPLILDPVACGSSVFRKECAQALLADYYFSAIRGNASEIACLAGINWQGHGIDAGHSQGNLVKIAQQCARRFHTTVVLSGETDIITDGNRILRNSATTDWLTINVGSGDILSSFIGAFMAVSNDPLIAGEAACRLVTTAGCNATKVTHGLGSWQTSFFDELTRLQDADLYRKDWE